jgi:hypothetical protein
MSRVIEHPSGPVDLLPPFPEVWDSSMRSAWVACPRQWYYGYLLGLRKSAFSIHLHFGGAFAHGLEATRKAFYVAGMDEVNAVNQGFHAVIRFWGDFELTDEIRRTRAGIKDLSACLDALLSYFETYPLSDDQVVPLVINGEAIIEKSFALPIPGTTHPTTGQPIVYAGRCDMVAQHRGGSSLFIVDEKTASQLGSSWLANWPLRGQLSGYVWGMRSYGIEPDGCVIRGVGILKQDITHMQSILTRPPWQIDQWLEQLRRDVTRAGDMWTMAAGLNNPHIAFDQAFDSACSSYGGCGYLDLCNSPSPIPWYENFEIRHWDPLQREGDIP